jgi:hypothetical protein
LALDWHAIRGVMDAAGKRFGVDLPASDLPPVAALTAIVEACQGAALERAVLFGGQQIVTQHRGLWDLLESRAAARIHD